MKEIKVKGFSFNEILNFGPVFLILGFIFYLDFQMLSSSGPLEGVVLKVVVILNLLALPLILVFINFLTTTVTLDLNGIHKKNIFGSKSFAWLEIKKIDVALERKRADPVFLQENEHLENFINGVKTIYVSKANPIVLKTWWKKDDNTISIPFRAEAYQFIREKLG